MEGGDVAGRSWPSRQAEDLLHRAMNYGATRLNSIARDAVARFVAGGNPHHALFTQAEKEELAETLAAVLATGNLLGRAQIQEKADAAKPKPVEERELADVAPKVMPPEESLTYFRRLVPTLGTDPQFDELMRRQAFTLAAGTETELLSKVKGVIDQRLATGQGIGTAPQEISQILADAGVSSANPQYGEMVFRTNAMDAYNQGASDQLRRVADTFPVWKYSAVMDERTRPDHAALNGKYFSAQTPFTSIRPQPFNCRCTFIPIPAWEWDELQSQGVQLEG